MAIKTQAQKTGLKEFYTTLSPERLAETKELNKLFTTITGEKPVLWGTSIIGFGKYHYKSERSRQEGDWPLTGFSPRKTQLSIYLMDGVKKYPELLKKLGPYKNGVSCLYIKRLEDIDLKVLKQLIAQSYKEMQQRYA